jgi:uridine kinase
MFLVAIAGPSGSGKTTIAHALEEALADVYSTAVISLDRYYFDLGHLSDDVRQGQNFDTPAAIEYRLLLDHIDRLAQGDVVALPRYNFATHLRSSQVDMLAAPDVLVVEGLFALYWQELRDCAGLGIFVDASTDVCLQRRIARDTHHRGRNDASVSRQFHRQVEPMRRKYIAPTQAVADLTVSGTDALSVVTDAIRFQISATWSPQPFVNPGPD